MDNFVDLFMVSPLLLAVLFFVAMLAGFSPMRLFPVPKT